MKKNRVIYMDNNATTQVASEVLEAMQPFFTEDYGNPSSMHSFGGNVEKHIEKAREQVAALIGAEPTEIVFTSCGTESDNTAIMSTLEVQQAKRHVITSKVEHPAVYGFLDFCERKGYRISRIPVDSEGLLDVQEFDNVLNEQTALVTIMHANNETGVIFPIEELAARAKAKGVLFHTDAVQTIGKLPIDMQKSTIDMLSLSGHKLHAPKGIGALYVRRGTRFSPFMIGGHQERGRRAGTENVASIVGLGKACELAAKYMDDENSRVRRLRDMLEEGLLKHAPDAALNGNKKMRLPNTANISFKYVEGEAILLHLNELNIAASSGSACTSGSLEPSRVLRSMGIPYTAAHGAVRFSLSRYNTEEEVQFVIEKLPPIITELRNISPFDDHSAYSMA
jgi:cysteine desulfurase